MIKKIIIAMGLPASGKSTLCKKIKNRQSFLLDFDECLGKNMSLDEAMDVTLKQIKQALYSRVTFTTMIVDGLFLQEQHISLFLHQIASIISLDNTIIEIHYFNDDRKTCKINDSGRRKQNSTITIDNAEYNYPTINTLYLLLKDINIKKKNIILFPETVIEKPKYKQFFDTGDCEYIYSDYWTAGGTYCDCWGGRYGLTPESPCEFIEFDELLEKICPTINFLDYKKLYRECVDVEDDSESDYYGGCAYVQRWRCNLSKLYHCLMEMNYIN